MSRPAFAFAFVALILFGCSSSGSGCGSSSAQFCKIDLTANICPGRVTVSCFEGATPESKATCTEAIKQEPEVVYCCAINNAAVPIGGAGGAGGAQ